MVESTQKILMIVGDYVEDYEVMVPYQALTMLGYTVHNVSPGKKAGDTIVTAIHDFEGQQSYSEKRGHNFMVNFNITDVNVKDYKGLILPGGRAPEYLRNNEKVLQIVDSFFSEKKPICAICHGAQILLAIKKKCEITAYPALKPDIIAAGCIYVGNENTYDNVVVDLEHKIVSTPAWVGHPEVLRKFVELLGATIKI